MIKIFLSFTIAATIFASCNNSNSSATDSKHLVVAANTAATKYQCPIHCEGDTSYTTKRQCVVCEMDLAKL